MIFPRERITILIVIIVLISGIVYFMYLGHPNQQLEEIIEDTYKCSEGILDSWGVSTPGHVHLNGWTLRPRVSCGNDPFCGGELRTSFLPWGCLSKERSIEDPHPMNTRVLLKELKTYFLIDGKWKFMQSTGRYYQMVSFIEEGGVWPWDMATRPIGSNHVWTREKIEYYNGEIVYPTEENPMMVTETSYFPESEWSIHWWSKTPEGGEGRIPLPDHYEGIFVSQKAKLIIDDPSKLSDINEARYVLIIGADYKPAEPYEGTECGIGRGKYVTKEWRNFYFTTLNEEELRANPPPEV